MPTRIYRTSNIREEVAYVCADNWDLDEQLWKLYEWVKENKSKIEGGNLVADIGYSVREGATGGGHALTKEEMRDYVEFGIDLYFSQYSSLTDE
jgi:hypothetical protein